MRRFELYRMTNSKTPLSEEYFNPIWVDIDSRIDALEAVKISWEEAVRQVSDFGLERIDEVLRPAFEYVEQKKGEIDSLIEELEEVRESIGGSQMLNMAMAFFFGGD